MNAADRPTQPRRLRISLQHGLSLLLIGAILAVGGVLAVHNYRETSRIILEAADDVFDRMGREVLLELGRTAAPVETLVDVFAMQGLADAATLDERLRQLPALAEALRQNPAITALYAGYENGSFFLVRPIRDDLTRAALRTPPQAAFVVQSIERGSGGYVARFLSLRDDLAPIESVDRPEFAFDPRTRSWYADALKSDRRVRTAPYLFFTTREPGITFARAARSRRAVIGADVTLNHLSQLLQRQKVAPSTELLLLTGDGSVVARNGVHTLARTEPSSGRLRLTTLAEADAAMAPAMAARLANGASAHNFTFRASDREWIGGLDRVAGEGDSPLYLATATPTAELLDNAEAIRTRSWWLTLALIACAIPLAWIAASRVSRPLRSLADGARAIQAFDFRAASSAPSRLREVDQLGDALRASTATVRHFLDISGTLAGERDVDRVIARVLDETMQSANADAGSIHLFDAGRRVLNPVQHLRRDGKDPPVPVRPVSLAEDGQQGNPVARAASEGRTVLADGLLAVPLRDRAGRIDGILSLERRGMNAGSAAAPVVGFVEQLSGVAAISIETRRLIAEQKILLQSFIELIAAAIDAKSPYTGGHCQRVPELTKLLARAACDARDGPYRDFTLSDDEWEAVHIASWLHDCGKVTTPEYVVDKATKLETLCDRIHEVRMRFEVLKRDAVIEYWKARAAGGDVAELEAGLAAELAALDADFAFVASCNEGGESMDEERIARLRRVGGRTWMRTLDDRLGASWEERQRKDRSPARPLPATETVLADKPEHIIERTAADRMPDDNHWGFRLAVPLHKYNRGELHNLTVGRGTLTDEERYKINDHIVQTIIMLERLPFPRHLAHVPEIAGGHHEKMDGGGYPRGLTQAQMSPLARMMAIADIFEALTAVDRPYKKGKKLSEAIRIMARMRDERHIDADLFELFLRSGVYRRYADAHMAPGQIDDVDAASFGAPA